MSVYGPALLLRALVAAGVLLAAELGGPAAAAAPAPTDYFASPTGSGTACTIQAPCSIEGARDHIRPLLAGMKSDIRVNLRGGVYRVDAPLALGVADSGTRGHRVIYRAYPGEQPVLSGARRVTGFQPFDQAKGIYRAPVPAGPLHDRILNSRDLSVDGVPGLRARTRAFSDTTWPGSGGTWKSVSYTATGKAEMAGISLAGLTDPSRVEVVDNAGWKQLRCPLASITGTTVTIPSNARTVPPFTPGGTSDEIALKTSTACWNAQQMTFPGYPFNGSGGPRLSHVGWLENAYQFLDAPGEFYLDPTAGYVYYKPRSGQDMRTADVEVAVAPQLLNVAGTPGHLSPVNATLANTVRTGAVASVTDTESAPARPYGDLDHDALKSTAPGDSISYTFTGAGIDVLGEKQPQGGDVQVSIDGGSSTTVSNRNPARLARQVLFSASGLRTGRHTVTVTNKSAPVLRLDGYTVLPTAVMPVHDLVFQGLDFTGTTWAEVTAKGFVDSQGGATWDPDTGQPSRIPAAIQVHRGSDITFVDNEISDTGGTGIDLADGTQHAVVTGNSIHDTDGVGVWAGEIDDSYLTDTTRMTSDITISQNRVSRVGLGFAGSTGIGVGYSRNLTIDHNDVGHTPYTGISLGWGWGWASDCGMQAAERNQQGATPKVGPGTPCTHGTDYASGNRITGNHVHDVMNVLDDGGFIYTLGGQGDGSQRSVESGNVVEVRNQRGTADTDKSLYPDEGSSSWDISDNVVRFADNTNWVRMWTPTIHDIHVTDNYASTAHYASNATDSTVEQATVVTDGNWPEAARRIIAAAGPTVAFRSGFPLIDDDDTAIEYRGTWSAAGGRGAGDVEGTLHWTSTDGDFATLTFSGTGVTVIGERNPSQGQVEVYLDGVSKGLVDTSSTTPMAQQRIYDIQGLPAATHTLKLVKLDGTTASVDAFKVDHTQ